MVTINVRGFARDAIGSGIGFWLFGPISIQAGVVCGGVYASVKQVVPNNLDDLFNKLDPEGKHEESWTDDWLLLKICKVACVILGTVFLQMAVLSKVFKYNTEIIPIFFFSGVGFHELLIGPIVNAAFGILF